MPKPKHTYHRLPKKNINENHQLLLLPTPDYLKALKFSSYLFADARQSDRLLGDDTIKQDISAQKMFPFQAEIEIFLWHFKSNKISKFYSYITFQTIYLVCFVFTPFKNLRWPCGKTNKEFR